MNLSREEAIALAREAGASKYTNRHYIEQPMHTFNVDQPVRFAALLQSQLAEGEQEPVAWMYPSDLEKFQESETFAQAFSIKVGCPDEVSVPLYAAPQGAPK